MTEEVELYVDGVRIKDGLLSHTWHSQLAFYQPFLDLIDAKITPDV